MACDIFISYSREDRSYIQKLADKLDKEGFTVFVDDRIGVGDSWWKTIDRAIRSSKALVVVMTPDSQDSSWVEKEIMLAQKIGKPIYPLLLKGEEFSILIDSQYVDVTGARLPPKNFYVRLKSTLGISDLTDRTTLRSLAMEEVDPVEETRKRLEDTGTPPAVAGLIALSVAIGVFEMEVLESGKPNKTFRRQIKGVVKGYGDNARLVPEMTDYRATAGREYYDDHGRTCREVTLTFNRDGEWITQSDVFFLQRGKWVRA